MVSPVNPAVTAARLALLLQRAFGAGEAQGTVTTSAAGAPATRSKGQRDCSFASKNVAAEWSTAEALRSRAKAISRDHPDRRRAVTRLLVEALLSREFGPDATADATHQSIIDDVVGVLGSTPGLNADLERVVTNLLEGQ